MTLLAVIDDDPTGAQSEAEVPLLLAWGGGLLRGRSRFGAVHLLTNSRALDAPGAYSSVFDAATAALGAMPERRIVLRGDSTLRGHVLEEYAAVCDAAFGGRRVPLVLVPALPAAGRVTRGGLHWLERDGAAVPIAATEYARDRRFGYASSRLLDWAAERSGGVLAAAAGAEIGLDALRGPDGPRLVASRLRSLAAAGRPAVLVPDAERQSDLVAIATGLARAWGDGVEFAVRCGPAFVGAAAGTTAPGFVRLPAAGAGVLVVVGSHVEGSTRQLLALVARRPGALVEVAAARLAATHGADRAAAIAAAAAQARARLAAGGLAIVATSRETPAELLAAEPGMRIARGLAAVLAGARSGAGVIVSKGGITSAVNVADGFGAAEALVVGPVADGIALWRVPVDGGDTDAALLVVPGNVGGDDALADLVDALLQG